MKKQFVLVVLLLQPFHAFGECKIFTSQGGHAPVFADVLSVILSNQQSCPEDIFDLINALTEDGLVVKAAMVANRGKHNPELGSFSFFEEATGYSHLMGRTIDAGHLFFGHFTRAVSGLVELDQSPSKGKLMVELIAWDFSKQVYNFYEMIGSGNEGIWFYRGDSIDALSDNRLLHLQPDPNDPQFGTNMRCSACHSSGGPIMKELATPHNDWWRQDDALPFGPNVPSPSVNNWLARLTDAADFANSVKKGIKLLEESPDMREFKQKLSFPEQLRALFCTTEINLVSDRSPLFSGQKVGIPAEYFINPLLLADHGPVEVDASLYIEGLLELGFLFPETRRTDADHGWLAPVKGYSDLTIIKSLLEMQVITEEFVADVLAVDIKRPLFSSKRCDLLRMIPPVKSADWLQIFEQNLRAKDSLAARELLKNLTESNRDKEFHRVTAKDYIDSIVIDDLPQIEFWLSDLDSKRNAVFSNEISKNPRGQILEPGFRVIFPEKSAR